MKRKIGIMLMIIFLTVSVTACGSSQSELQNGNLTIWWAIDRLNTTFMEKVIEGKIARNNIPDGEGIREEDLAL